MKKLLLTVLLFFGTVFSMYLGACSLLNLNWKTITIDKPIEEPIKEEPKERYTKLMIVAHPDDDSIFGGNHLVSDDYYVVCVTCGVVEKRLNEFKNAMEYSDDKYEYLGHTDLEGQYISNWVNEKEIIEEEIKNIINSKDWDLIVTHNPDGEYGHKHHRMINQMVTNNTSDKSKLYYFGKWHTKDEVTEEDIENLNEKKYELLSKYPSQNLNMNSRFLYMFIHEDWISYNDWA